MTSEPQRRAAPTALHNEPHSGAAAAALHNEPHGREASEGAQAAASTTPSTVLVRILGAADGTPTPHDGRWLAEWNPHTDWGTLGLTSTADPAAAKRFPHTEEVFRQWRTTSLLQPLRPDGRPNKPLTAVSIEVHPHGS